MKKLIHLLIFCGLVNLQAQTNNTDFFKGNSFNFDHFLIDGIKQIPTYSFIDGPRDNYVSSIYFQKDENSLNEDDLTFSTSTGCISYTAQIKNDYFKITEQGAGTLISCPYITNLPNYEEIITGYYDESMIDTSSGKVYYTIDKDRQGFTAYTENQANTQLVYKTQTVASVSKQELEQYLQIIPNPTNKTLSIEALQLIISKVSIFDTLGRNVLITNENFTNISVKQLTKGVYFVQVNSNKGNITKQVFIN